MLNAVWVAVIVAVAAWVVLAAAVVYALVRFSRLVTETSQAVAGLRERGDELIDRGHTALDLANEQLARTDAITSSMDEVTANMAALTGRVAALAPLARLLADSARGPVGRVIAFGYGVNRAVTLRWAGGPRTTMARAAAVPPQRQPLTARRRTALPSQQSSGMPVREEAPQ